MATSITNDAVSEAVQPSDEQGGVRKARRAATGATRITVGFPGEPTGRLVWPGDRTMAHSSCVRRISTLSLTGSTCPAAISPEVRRAEALKVYLWRAPSVNLARPMAPRGQPWSPSSRR